MTYFDPIFSSGIMGKANARICNSWTDAARFAAENQEPVRWAAAQSKKSLVIARALCKITAASLFATNRWNYTTELWAPTGAGGLAIPADSWFATSYCKNIRELFNEGYIVDGMDLSTPAASVGPVGSVFTSGAWTVSSLKAVVEVSITYDTAGKAYAYFDRPNPMRCSE